MRSPGRLSLAPLALGEPEITLGPRSYAALDEAPEFPVYPLLSAGLGRYAPGRGHRCFRLY